MGDPQDQGKRMFTGSVIQGRGKRQIGIHPIISLASFLDPRMKDLFMYRSNCEDIPAIHDFVLSKMIEVVPSLPTDVTGIPKEDNQNNNEVPQNHVNDNQIGEESNDYFDFLFGDNNEVVNNIQDEPITIEEMTRNVCKSEMERYINAPKLSPKKLIGTDQVPTCPLQDWWKIHHISFPILATLSKKYLCIPPSSAPSERVFSTASLILSKKRNRLDSKNAGSLLFVKKNMEWYYQQVSDET